MVPDDNQRFCSKDVKIAVEKASCFASSFCFCISVLTQTRQRTLLSIFSLRLGFSKWNETHLN